MYGNGRKDSEPIINEHRNNKNTTKIDDYDYGKQIRRSLNTHTHTRHVSPLTDSPFFCSCFKKQQKKVKEKLNTQIHFLFTKQEEEEEEVKVI